MINYKKRHFLNTLFLLTLLLGSLYAYANTQSSAFAQTIPTRTPTPAPSNGGGGSGGGNGGGGGGGGSTQPTATPVPPTNTPTLEPLNFNLEPCGSLVFAADLGIVNVRSGPGVDYEEIGEIPFAETVPVIGRAEFATWWNVELDNGQQGWVSDAIGTVYGNTARARLIDSPPLPNGNTPTPGPQWQPTADASCPTLTPSPTAPPPTETLPATAVSTNVSSPGSSPSTVEREAEEEATEEPTVTVEPTEIATLTPLPATATAEPTAVATAVTPVEITPSPTVETSTAPNSNRLSSFLAIGFGLLLFGFVVVTVRRTRG